MALDANFGPEIELNRMGSSVLKRKIGQKIGSKPPNHMDIYGYLVDI